MGEILIKIVFLAKVSLIQLNYAFLLFWSIFAEILSELLFLVKKLLSQKVAMKYPESLLFLTCLKRVTPEENLYLFKQPYLIKPLKWGKY